VGCPSLWHALCGFMGDRLSSAVVDIGARRSDALVEALARHRSTAERPRDVEAVLELVPHLDIVFFSGGTPSRNAACSAIAALAPFERPFVVALLGEEDSIEAALAAGADDVLEPNLLRLPALLRHAERFRKRSRETVLEPGGMVALVSDFVTQVDTQGIITYVNRDGPNRTVSEAIGSHALDHVPPEDREGFSALLAHCLSTGAAHSIEADSYDRRFRVRTVPIVSDGKVVGATIIAADITEVSNVLSRLKESERQARAILDALPDLVFRMHADGTYLAAHAPKVDELYLPLDEVIGSNIEQVLPPHVAVTLKAAIARVAAEKKLEIITYELPMNGATEHYEARIVPAGDNQTVAVVRNMTQENRNRERLAFSERLASLGTMAAGVAHELNSPLTFVMLGLEWLERQLTLLEQPSAGPAPKPGALGERVREVLESAHRIQRIVRDLKGFTRPEEAHASLIDIPSAVDGALSLAAAELRYRARIEKSYEPSPPVFGNQARLGQVFLNLLVNAAHALPEDRSADNAVHVRSFQAADGRVAVEISDTGAGIAREHLPHLFEPFFTTKPVGQGTGLGLWICHEIVADLGGEIQVESEIGVGSTFRVLLPLGSAPSSPSTPPPPPTPSPPRARILVIDDEPNLAMTLAHLLDEHSVEVALGGASALEKLAEDAEFDLILCDLMMPGTNGMDVYASAIAVFPFLASRFVFMTGGAFTPRAKAFLAETSLPRLEKPFRIEAVTALLEQKKRAK
jgi:signal transduction histidine kinase/CheY-like chemotaxis protein